MRAGAVVLALAAALAVQSTIAGLTVRGATTINLVLVAVVYSALAFGPVTGLLAGTAGGLAQDALAGGIVGIGAFSKTLVGFVVGVLGAQFIVAQPLSRFLMFIGATLLHELCFQALYAVAEARDFRLHYRVVLMQAGLNAAIGVIAFQLVEVGPGLLQRRRSRGATLSRRQY
jgi:rod shape-determining protein MreD